MSRRKNSSTLRRQIDENLRRVYQEAAEEAVPDRFHDLLKKLKEQDEERNAGRDDDDTS